MRDLRDGELAQITVDHTVSEIMFETGKMSREEARHSPMGHALWNVLGGRSNELAVDVYKLPLGCKDVLLLCTDGLYNMVPHEALQDLLTSNRDAESGCRKLVDLANQNGGKDNITAIVSHFLAPKADDSCAFVDAEVPLKDLTDVSSETSATVVFSDPTDAVKSGAI